MDRVWTWVGAPVNQPVITVVLESLEPSDGDLERVLAHLRRNDLLSRVLVGPRRRPRWAAADLPESLVLERTCLALSEVLNEGPKDIDPRRAPWRAILGAGFLVLELHHCLGDGTTLLAAALGAMPSSQSLAGSGSRTYRPGLAAIVAASRELMSARRGHLGRAQGGKVRTLLGPWPLKEVKRVAEERGASVNGWLTGALSCALTELGHGDATAAAALEGLGTGANGFALVLGGLEEMSTAPRSRWLAQASASYGAIQTAGLLGPRLASVMLGALGSRVDLIVSNIRGPADLELAGVRLRAGFLVPMVGEVPLGVSLLSANGEVRVGLSVDQGCALPPEALTRSITAALASSSGSTASGAGAAHPGQVSI